MKKFLFCAIALIAAIPTSLFSVKVTANVILFIDKKSIHKFQLNFQDTDSLGTVFTSLQNHTLTTYNATTFVLECCTSTDFFNLNEKPTTYLTSLINLNFPNTFEVRIIAT